MTRPKITAREIDSAIKEMQAWMFKRLNEKGNGSFSSIHEIRGMIDEEFNELREAMHNKDQDAIAHELKDVIVGALFALACLRSGKLDW